LQTSTTPKLIINRDIVVITIQPWYYELGSNCKNIATELSKHNRVLYVNIPITRKTYYNKQNSEGVAKHCSIIRNKGKTIEQIKENMWQFYPTTLIESINWLPFTSVFRMINRMNNKRFAADIQQAIDQLGFKDVILFNDNDIYNGFHLKEFLSPALYIYYMRDFLQGYDFWKKHSSVLEPILISKADITVANSLYYADYCSKFNQRSSYIGQGCKLDLFDPEKISIIPDELKHIPRPIIGYIGALDSSRLDHTIISIIAKADTNWQVVLVGPEDEAFQQSDLHQLLNIHFIGRKPIEQLASFMKGFDVCINPQLINLITSGNYPLKIDEYLAMGKPVVATATKAMELFKEYTYMANTPNDYPGLVSTALKESNEETAQKGIAFARSHTWENSILKLYEAIEAANCR
jgi:teichuronic acid biosynthesis glycosyltransferase TuaH